MKEQTRNTEVQINEEEICKLPGKEYIDPHKTPEDEGTRGKNKSVNRTGPALGRWGD